MAIIPQTQAFKLFGAGASTGDTSITLQSFKNLDGTNLTMAHFGGTKGYLTIEPNLGTQEEQVSFTTITNNANGTVTLGNIKNVLDYTPFTETVGLKKTHGGNVEVIVSNTSGFYNNVVAGTTASQITNVPAGSIAATDVQAAINELDNEVTNNALHKAGAETVTGKKTFDVSARPTLSSDTDATVATDFVTFGQLSRSPAAGGAANASTTVKGIVEEATDAEVVASTATGATGARLFINPSSVGNTANKIPFLDASGKLANSTIPNQKFGGTGVDGALSVSSGAFNIDLGGAAVFIKNYSSISITGTGYVTFTNQHANGTIIVLKNKGNSDITTSATSAFVLSNTGAGAGLRANSTLVNVMPGGNGALYVGGGVVGTPGLGGVTGGNISNLFFTKSLACGAGGGTGPTNFGSAAGGVGGGCLYIETAGTLNFTSTVSANGGNGAVSGSGNGGGGGGGGEVVFLANGLGTNTGIINVNGGTGGNYGPSGNGGGGGGASVTNNGNSGGDGIGGNGATGYKYVGLNTEFV